MIQRFGGIIRKDLSYINLDRIVIIFNQIKSHDSLILSLESCLLRYLFFKNIDYKTIKRGDEKLILQTVVEFIIRIIRLMFINRAER